jgi:hypothetical protein
MSNHWLALHTHHPASEVNRNRQIGVGVVAECPYSGQSVAAVLAHSAWKNMGKERPCVCGAHRD